MIIKFSFKITPNKTEVPLKKFRKDRIKVLKTPKKYPTCSLNMIIINQRIISFKDKDKR